MTMDRTMQVGARWLCAARLREMIMVLVGLLHTNGMGLAQTPPPTPPAPTPITVPPVVTLNGDAVSVSGMTKTGSAVVFGVSRRSVSYSERLERDAGIVADSDGDGVLSYDVPDGLPWKSVWAAVDLPSGLYAAAAPEGWTLEEIAFPGHGIGASLNTLETEADFEQVLWVRPGSGGGAWVLAAGDGGESDEDGKTNHRVRLAVERFEAVGTSPAHPEKFAPGDVLVGVDANTLSYFAARLAN